MKSINSKATASQRVSTLAIALIFSSLQVSAVVACTAVSSYAVASTVTHRRTGTANAGRSANQGQPNPVHPNLGNPNLGNPNLGKQRGTVRRSPPPPPPPPSPVPRGSNVGGGSLGGLGCGATAEKLISVTPHSQSPALTTAEHPTLYFYMPYSATEVEYGEFSVFSGQGGTNRIYKARFTVPERPGFLSVSLPRSPEQALKSGENYHWYFKLYCKGNTEGNADVWVDGWMQRTTGRQRAWYDDVMQLMQQPSSPEQRDRWQAMLQAVDGDRQIFNAEELAQRPYVGALNLIPQ